MRSRILAVLLLNAILISPAAAACHTEYTTICTEYDSNGRCAVFERQSQTVCDGSNTSIEPRECFVCDAYNKDGSCKRTHKADC